MADAGDVKWRFDISSTRKVSMREYPDDLQKELEANFGRRGLNASTVRNIRGVDYEIHWCEQNESWKQTRCDDLDKWRYVERYIKPPPTEPAAAAAASRQEKIPGRCRPRVAPRLHPLATSVRTPSCPPAGGTAVEAHLECQKTQSGVHRC